MIKAIIFDCFGVLTSDSWKEFVRALPEELRVPASDLNRAYDAGILDAKAFSGEVIALTGRQPEYEELLSEEKMAKNHELFNYIRGLKTSYKIGMLSNVASNWITENFLTAEEQELFDAMVFSYQVGASKPDPRVYEAICNKLGVEPEQCVFIDDSERYCTAANELGMHAVWYKDFGQMKVDLEKVLHNSKS